MLQLTWVWTILKLRKGFRIKSMALFLEITKGPSEGQKFRLDVGTRIGRTTGEILIRDPRASGLHAQVESGENGQLFLVDRGSANGLRIDGKKLHKLALMPGVNFRIGSTFFRVIEFSAEALFSQVPETSMAAWKKKLISGLSQMALRNSDETPKVLAFDPAIELQFIEGIQADTKIILGYGPRKAGSDVLDIELRDPQSPDIAFEIFPAENGEVRFETAFPDQVRINDEAASSCSLKSGDRIRVGSSLIEIRFVV